VNGDSIVYLLTYLLIYLPYLFTYLIFLTWFSMVFHDSMRVGVSVFILEYE